jgi:hypothetical protein
MAAVENSIMVKAVTVLHTVAHSALQGIFFPAHELQERKDIPYMIDSLGAH